MKIKKFPKEGKKKTNCDMRERDTTKWEKFHVVQKAEEVKRQGKVSPPTGKIMQFVLESLFLIRKFVKKRKNYVTIDIFSILQQVDAVWPPRLGVLLCAPLISPHGKFI